MERVSPLWLGIGISGTLILILLVTETLLGKWGAILIAGEFDAFARVSSGPLRDLRIAIVHCLQVGYLPAAFLYVLQTSRRTVFVLKDSLDCTAEECETLAESIRLKPHWLLLIGLIAFTLSIVGPYLVPPVPVAPWDPTTWSSEVVWHRILGPVTQVLAWWLGFAVIVVSARMSNIARKLSRIDLLDLSPLTPFTQLGLSNALMLIGSLSIWSLMTIETGFGAMMIVIGGTTLVSSAVALLLPVRGVHQRIRQAKDAELGWVNGEISSLRNQIRSKDFEAQSGDLADLVAYRGLIDSVHEWPFTTSTFTRLFLYALIPVASWGIGIVAEEIVGRMLF